MEKEFIMLGKFTIATCQHAVSNDLLANCDVILKQIRIAKSNKARIVHFSECNLSGYAGFEFSDIKSQDKDELQYVLQKIKETARELNIWERSTRMGNLTPLDFLKPRIFFSTILTATSSDSDPSLPSNITTPHTFRS